MNTFLQIGIGLLPGSIVAAALLIKRRAFNVQKIITTALLCILCGVMLCVGISGLNGRGSRKSGEMPQKKMLAFAYALAEEGAVEAAEEVIDQYSEVYGYDDKCRLLNARLAVLEDDNDKAAHLYAYLCENTSLVNEQDEEVIAATAQSQDNVADLIMMDYLKSVGEDISEYGYTETAYTELKQATGIGREDVKNNIKEVIENEYAASDDMKKYAATVAEVSDLDIDKIRRLQGSEEAGQYKKVFSEIERKSDGMNNLVCVDKARIKALVATGDYDAITKNMDDDSSYHSLMVASELYMSGLVGKSDFPEAYHEVNKTDAKAVEKRLDKVYEKTKEDLTVQEKKALRARISAIENELDDPVLMTLKEQLTEASEHEAGTDQTKVYLEIAKIEDYFGNESSTDSYLSSAIYSSQDNEDDTYVSSMSKIIHVISDDEEDDLEDIKNVDEYVDSVLDHSLTVDVEEIVSPQYNETEAVAEQDYWEEDWGENWDTAEESLPEKTEGIDFARTAVDYVSRIKNAISIGKIDVSNFEEITARVQIDTDRYSDVYEIRDALKVYDCGGEIHDFSLEKIEYTGSNIILVCDVSGSMSGSMEDLRDAVVTFITDKNPDESLAVITFNDNIVDTRSFGTPDSELISFAQSMESGGGTDMFSATLSALGDFSSSDTESNVLILMTDGQDNNAKSAEEISSQIGGLALQKGVTVYTMGLGSSVDTAYLNQIASSGNGEFVYISNSSSLTSFYDMLHAQLYSQYELKYRALDTITVSGRTLEVALPEDQTNDVKTYSLNGEDAAGLNATQGLSISGLNPRYVYKGLQSIPAKLKGTGFNENSSITVKLNGIIDYTLPATYVDAETYALVIPSSVAVGTYNVEISIDGKKKVLQNGFSVIEQGDEKKTAFGPYVFTSMNRIENGEHDVTLSGAVTMNGWLHFKGDVTLVGDLENAGSISVGEYDGSYVNYDEATSEGIGKILAEKGISLDLPALRNFTLYNDPAHQYDYENYMVDDISTDVLAIYNLLQFDSPVVRLYPDSIGLYYSTGTTMLPYQDKIMRIGETGMFKFSYDGSAQITNKNVGIVLDISYNDRPMPLAGDSSKHTYNHKLTLLNTPVGFNGAFMVKINTLKNEYTLGAMVGFDFFAKGSGLGAEVSWKEHLYPDSVKLSLKLDTPVKLPTTIPIEVNDFSFMVSDINQAVEDGTIARLKFAGSASFSSGKLIAYIPGLKPFVGDVSILEMPDTTASIRVSPFTMEANAKLVFLSQITLAEAGVQLGNFDYSNSLLQLDGENVNGLSATLKAGIMWNTMDDRVKLDISGSGEFDAHSRFLGAIFTGTVNYDIGWWIINTENSMRGDVALGLYTTHSGKTQLIFTYRTQDGDGENRFYYIDENGKCGRESGVLY